MRPLIPVPRHLRLSTGRRRLIAAGSGALAYLAIYAAVVLGIASLFEPTAPFVLAALGVGALALLGGAAALAVDSLLSRVRRPRRRRVAFPR